MDFLMVRHNSNPTSSMDEEDCGSSVQTYLSRTSSDDAVSVRTNSLKSKFLSWGSKTSNATSQSNEMDEETARKIQDRASIKRKTIQNFIMAQEKLLSHFREKQGNKKESTQPPSATTAYEQAKRYQHGKHKHHHRDRDDINLELMNEQFLNTENPLFNSRPAKASIQE